MKMKNNLDERQEQVLLRIEHNGYYIAFWGLLIVFSVESLIFNFDLKAIIGECAVFLILCIYMFVACMKNGIWDRRLKPNFTTNLIVSIIASVIYGILMAVSVWIRYPGKPVGSIAAGVITALFVFIPCIILLTLSAKRINKKISEQEEEDADQI